MGTSSTLLEEDRNSDFFLFIQKNGFPVSIYKNKKRPQIMLAHSVQQRGNHQLQEKVEEITSLEDQRRAKEQEVIKIV